MTLADFSSSPSPKNWTILVIFISTILILNCGHFVQLDHNLTKGWMFCRKGYFLKKYNQGCKGVPSWHHLPQDQLRSPRLSCEQKTERIDIGSNIAGEGGETERERWMCAIACQKSTKYHCQSQKHLSFKLFHPDPPLYWLFPEE